jgi:hypothetical protein
MENSSEPIFSFRQPITAITGFLGIGSWLLYGLDPLHNTELCSPHIVFGVQLILWLILIAYVVIKRKKAWRIVALILIACPIVAYILYYFSPEITKVFFFWLLWG